MSSIGRILIVVNLVLAGAFLGWASQVLKAGQNYKESYEEELAAHDATRDDLEVQLSTLNTEVQANRQQVATLREQANQLAAQRDALTSSLNDAEADNDALRSTLDGLNERLDLLANSVESAESRAAEAAREARDAVVAQEDAKDAQAEAELARRDAQDEARRLGQSLAALEAEAAQLREALGTAESNLETVAKLTGFDLGSIVDAPALDRAIVDVRLDLTPGFVAINAGSADGIRRGMEFDVYRGATYKGKVRVETVSEGMCTAVVTTSVAGAAIQVGDNATTAL